MLVDEMDKNPCEGVYIFRNKKSDKVKLCKRSIGYLVQET
jgi:hypothetical protein